ncbi:efflux RND transporter periplasmic adaptor subunit [Pseudobacter ginsenosidimutans]|uniref:HlyD family secretion protein n=1 Tax=Pseudobacter ginsenosidimutans TaxID=661488 RepID=A0A4Q7N5Y3_9BACT|nr:HlyD family efflux transporter periplasmic adaptor subunit [Pseudobacter ginsenosidimutans]QEC44981.1 HlyD family efflux transporter periplasmic adaptor subunit [Pseudobacter ginsenosidimutans]RZS76475.1 HlyD family secretion protein [Pseudobacter ginsenosidimutans]
MDRVIAKKKWTTKKLLTILGIAAILILITASYYFTSGKSRLNVNMERITISEVRKGTFQEFIPVNGVVLPITTIYLDALEGGRVEEKFVEDGAVMVKGQPILRLSNTDLALSLVNQETSVYNLLTQMQIANNAAQQNTVTKLNQLTDVENTLKEAEREYSLNKKLFAEKVIGSQEFKKSENNYIYQVQKKKLTDEIMRQDSVTTRQSVEQARELYQRSKATLDLTRKKVGDLIVRAPVDGQLTSLEAEIGQNKNKGERLGQIDVLSGFKVRADIDEHYISRIYNGLSGEFTFANKTYKLKIIKVFTQVTNGRFQVDMEFEGEKPQGIRRGQTLQIRLALSDETEALLLAKGGFYQQTGGNSIFKLSDDGKTAYKVDIQLGRQNPDYYEVLKGLKPGDKVITSSYENYDKMQELILKKE